jgi:hypothetical protein
VETTDLLVHDAELLATVDDARREVPGGWVAVAGRSVVEDGVPVHPGLEEPPAVHRRVSARMQAAP